MERFEAILFSNVVKITLDLQGGMKNPYRFHAKRNRLTFTVKSTRPIAGTR
jgi:hypothetical protein